MDCPLSHGQTEHELGSSLDGRLFIGGQTAIRGSGFLLFGDMKSDSLGSSYYL